MALFVPVAICSCSGDKKSNISEVVFADGTATVEGKPFTGEIWSDDNKTYCLETDNGVVTAFKIYHSNGTAAYVMASPADTLEAFDETGNSIPLDTFIKRYESLADEMTAVNNKIKGEDKAKE
mgnify:CR=1 FL=1